MRFGVLGGGFGVYGWLPAAVLVPGAKVTTLARYETRLRARPELAHLPAIIRFVDEIEDLLEVSDCLVIAQRPSDQARIAREVIRRSWRGYLVLEKPLAPDPPRAHELLAALSEAKVRVLMGFLMDRTEWGRALAESFVGDRPTRVDITWRFLAHHYRHSLDSWKRRPSDGGGALRFFAIHLIALLARFGEWTVPECSSRACDLEDPDVTFSLSLGGTEVRVRCDSRWQGEPEFTVRLEGHASRWSCSLRDPFTENSGSDCSGPAVPDRRVSYLAGILTDVPVASGEAASVFGPHLSLWSRIEAVRSHA